MADNRKKIEEFLDGLIKTDEIAGFYDMARGIEISIRDKNYGIALDGAINLLRLLNSFRLEYAAAVDARGLNGGDGEIKELLKKACRDLEREGILSAELEEWADKNDAWEGTDKRGS